MAYLKNNNNKVTVDAILTKYGKTKLASQGKLDIVKFAVADDEIDYALYNSMHPQGSDFYGIALTSLPTLEALPEEYMSMKYPLFSVTSGILDGIAELRLNFTNAITSSGISDYTVYPITPSFNPEPGDTTRIYYVGKITIPQPILPPGGGGGISVGGGGGTGGGGGVVEPIANDNPISAPIGSGGGEIIGSGGGGIIEGTTDNGMKFKLTATINEQIGITPAIIAARGYYRDTAKYKYGIGHGFTFQVTRFGRDSVSLPFTVTPFGINARPITIIIKVNGRTISQIEPNIEVQ